MIGVQDKAVTAIDIALEPDETMIGKAKAANATLLQDFPKGFSLDATHHPHVSIFAGFVPTADLPEVYAVGRRGSGEGKLHRLEIDRVQILLHPARPNRPRGHRGQADA